LSLSILCTMYTIKFSKYIDSFWAIYRHENWSILFFKLLSIKMVSVKKYYGYLPIIHDLFLQAFDWCSNVDKIYRNHDDNLLIIL